MAKGKGKKHSTPEELDPLFQRDVIREEDYGEFWRRWFKYPSPRDRDDLVEEFLEAAREYEEEVEEEEGVESVKEIFGTVTQVRKTAERQAARMGGKVVRRNARGQFSKRGKYYQAIRRKPK